MTNKERYLEFYNEHKDINIYSAPWWLDATAGSENWDVILIYDKNQNIIASFPFIKTKSFFIKCGLVMPLLTQKLGPYIVYDTNKISEMKNIGFEHEVYKQIIAQLPKFDTFNINFDQKYKNWLPFYWAGFNQTSRYSYKIFNIKDLDSVFKNFALNKRQKIKKAEKLLSIKEGILIEDFYSYFEDAVKKRGEHVSYSLDFFKKLVEACYNHNSGKIYYCIDDENNIHAAAFVVWDKRCAYYLSAMRNPKYNTSGGNELLVWHIIKEVSQFVDEFDFEGSMIQGVEESYRYYGGIQTEYYNISKDNRLFIPVIRDFLHSMKSFISFRNKRN